VRELGLVLSDIPSATEMDCSVSVVSRPAQNDGSPRSIRFFRSTWIVARIEVKDPPLESIWRATPIPLGHHRHGMPLRHCRPGTGPPQAPLDLPLQNLTQGGVAATQDHPRIGPISPQGGRLQVDLLAAAWCSAGP